MRADFVIATKHCGNFVYYLRVWPPQTSQGLKLLRCGPIVSSQATVFSRYVINFEIGFKSNLKEHTGYIGYTVIHPPVMALRNRVFEV